MDIPANGNWEFLLSFLFFLPFFIFYFLKKSTSSKSRAKCFCFDLFSISKMFLLWGTICEALEIQKAHLLCTIKMCC